MLADGAKAGEQVAIDVTISGEHVNYDIVATHNGETILDESGNHSHTGEGSHTTSALSADASDDNPIDVTVTFQGFGIPGEEFTGPIGLTNTASSSSRIWCNSSSDSCSSNCFNNCSISKIKT